MNVSSKIRGRARRIAAVMAAPCALAVVAVGAVRDVDWVLIMGLALASAMLVAWTKVIVEINSVQRSAPAAALASELNTALDRLAFVEAGIVDLNLASRDVTRRVDRVENLRGLVSEVASTAASVRKKAASIGTGVVALNRRLDGVESRLDSAEPQIVELHRLVTPRRRFSAKPISPVELTLRQALTDAAIPPRRHRDEPA